MPTPGSHEIMLYLHPNVARPVTPCFLLHQHHIKEDGNDNNDSYHNNAQEHKTAPRNIMCGNLWFHQRDTKQVRASFRGHLDNHLNRHLTSHHFDSQHDNEEQSAGASDRSTTLFIFTETVTNSLCNCFGSRVDCT